MAHSIKCLFPCLFLAVSALIAIAQQPGEVPLKDSDKPGPVCPSKSPAYADIDKHALKATKEAEADVPTLVAYLVRPAKTDAQKARAIFRWITDRITYDADSFAVGKFGNVTPAKVLANRTATCEGFTALFNELCKGAKLEAARVPGFVPFGTMTDDNLKMNHAWNAVKLDGRWYLLDASWGAGDVSPLTGKWEKNFREFWFLTPPERFAYSHYPTFASHQLLKPPISAAVFRQHLQVPRELVLFGAPVKDIDATQNSKDFAGFVKIAWDLSAPLTIAEAPLAGSLKRGKTYRLRFEAPTCSGMALVSNGQGRPFTKKGQEFAATVTPTAGKVQIGVQFQAKGKGYFTFLEYDVE